ncbi:receptor-like kinase LIP2 isoform X3 [Manihot esculenta]|uniref:receptor-like kinase LIP2 isoform X3 n=1 Tax=Manihot esculenta TaxID=3983 RepID=UPI001CC355C9|nr:receptor-like kinase LIP2 isoform X3 [Manihot esculenta]
MALCGLFNRRKANRHPTTGGQPQLAPQATQEQSEPEHPKAPPSGLEKLESVPKFYTYEQLAKATADFTNNNLIGVGGCGQVYRGELPDGEVVAIKKLKYVAGQAEMEGAQLQFETEIETISRVRHRNLVKVIGYCSDKADKLFVCEFVPNKSLKYHLQRKGNQINNWSNRMKIALGSAKGLTYLHEGCTPTIIHRDIKSENILLDHNFEPKIADFGLAKFFPITNSVTHISSHWKGTNVYADPENYNTQQGESIQQLSDKSDVYSFGVVLLELISGRKINDEHQVDIVKWAKPLMIKGDSVEINYSSLVDSTLKGHYDEKEMEIMIYCAAASVYRPAKLRPRMKQIVEALEGKMSPSELWAVQDVKFISRKPNELELQRPSLLEKFDFDLLAEAAGHFSGERRLRRHGSCEVYEGELPGSDQRKVAIKKLDYMSFKQNKEEFEKEIMAISNVNHRNIVNLIGYCSDEEDNRLLVFEFVANNSLKFHLHENGGSTIDWTRRMEIAKGAARGLKYMHEDSGHKILHLYVKSDNILFDDKFIPKLAEFGSAKIFPDSLTHLSISKFKQNSGYMAPEYQSTIKLTDKLDIYSFGVILLELITGKQPFGHFSGPNDMVNWAKPLLSQSLLEGKDKLDFVDEKLQEYNTEQMDRMIACVLACVDDDPQRRPRMSQILDVLEGNKSLKETIKFLNLNQMKSGN